MKIVARCKGMKATHANAITRHKGSKAQRHKGSTDECNNKCKNSNKAQGVKATMRCKGAKVACMKATTSVKVATRCKGMKVACMKVATSAKARTRCKGTRATHAKVIARCEGTTRYKNNSRAQRQSKTQRQQKKLYNNGIEKALTKLKQKHPSTHKTQDSMRKTSKRNKKGRNVPFVKNITVYRR
jgi:hypothetical protein